MSGNQYLIKNSNKAEGGLMPGEDPPKEYSKVDYTRINWENKSTSLKTPINESNLNKMDKAISDLCENLDIAHSELQDIRVKADGTTAKNAGNAVREQISELKSDFGNLRFSITENNLLHVERKE